MFIVVEKKRRNVSSIGRLKTIERFDFSSSINHALYTSFLFFWSNSNMHERTWKLIEKDRLKWSFFSLSNIVSVRSFAQLDYWQMRRCQWRMYADGVESRWFFFLSIYYSTGRNYSGGSLFPLNSKLFMSIIDQLMRKYNWLCFFFRHFNSSYQYADVSLSLSSMHNHCRRKMCLGFYRSTYLRQKDDKEESIKVKI